MLILQQNTFLSVPHTAMLTAAAVTGVFVPPQMPLTESNAFPLCVCASSCALMQICVVI